MAPHHALACTVLLLGFFTSASAYLNLYMNETETRRLLGITAELYYVRNGTVNVYALSFNLPIKTEVREIYFTWQNLRRTPPASAMFYHMGITSTDPRAMNRPQASIASDGIVPTRLTWFKVTLPCTGRVDAEVDVRIQMNVSIFSASNITVLDLKRRKMCRKAQPDVMEYGAGFGKDPDSNSSVLLPIDSSRMDNNFMTTSTNIFYIAVGCACAIILLIAFIVAAYYVRSQKNNHNERKSEVSSSMSAHGPHTFLRADTPNNASSIGGSFPNLRRGFSPVSELKASEVRSVLCEIHIDRKRVSLGEVLLEGTFGRIYHGTLIGEDENELGSEQEVYIKTVTDQARFDQIDTLLKEACMMRGLCHPNVNPIVGACLDNDCQPLLAFPFANKGNLKKFLQRCKVSDITSHHTLSTQQLVYMAIQIIRGIQYLHRKRIVHKDLATRNCVIDHELTVKVTDTALSRDLFPNDYHCLGDNENRPVKWLSLESLELRRFSPASDVWAFGVLLWELMTLGCQPYADIDPFEMAPYLKEGYRISQPINCPDELFAVMACCWALSPDERPRFSQLLVCLQDFYTALGRYI